MDWFLYDRDLVNEKVNVGSNENCIPCMVHKYQKNSSKVKVINTNIWRLKEQVSGVFDIYILKINTESRSIRKNICSDISELK